MPLYEYECSNCEYIFDSIQSIHEDPLKTCPECAMDSLEKLISMPARPVVPGDPRDAMAQIRQDAKKTAREILRGNQEAIADVYGSEAAEGKPVKRASSATAKAPVVKRT